MATVTKDFKIKSGLIVEGATGTVNGSDIITAEKITGGTNIGVDVTYENGVVNFEVQASEAVTELAQDAVAAALANGTHTNITVDYDDENNAINLTGAVTYTDDDARQAISVEVDGPLTYNSTTGELDVEVGDGLTVQNGQIAAKITSSAGAGQYPVSTDISGNLVINLPYQQNGNPVKIDQSSGEILLNYGSGLEVNLFDDSLQVKDSYVEDLAVNAISVESATPLTYNAGEVGFTLGNYNGGLGLDTNNYGLEIDRNVVDTWYDAAGSAGDVQDSVDAHTILTSAHGVTGDIVGTSDTQTLTNKSLGSGTYLQADLDAGSKKVINLAEPVDASDAATKGYVDAAVSGLNWKEAVNLLADSNVNLSASPSEWPIDGHAKPTTEYRVLFTGQTNDAENGIYVFDPVVEVYTRADDADTYEELIGSAVFVMEGTQYGATSWVQSNHYLSDFTSQAWSQFSGQGTYTAGANLELTGNEFALADEITLSTVNADLVGNVTGDITGDVYASNGTKVLDAGDGQAVPAEFTGNVTGNLNGNVSSSGTLSVTGAGEVTVGTTSDKVNVIADGNINLNSFSGNIVLTSSNGTILESDTYLDSVASDNLLATQGDLDGYLNSTEGSEGTTILYVQEYVGTAIETGDATATPTYLALDVNSLALQVAAEATAGGTGTDVVYSFDATVYKSAKFLVKIASGTHTQVSEVLLTHDTSYNVAITEYAVVGTNGSLGDVTAASAQGTNLIVNNAPQGAVITVMGTLLV